MSEQLYLCVHAAEFPAQALLRLRPEMQSQPVAVLEGRAPLEAICALNRHAERRGVVCGMTRLEAEAIAGLRLLSRSTESEAAARAVVRECAAYYSPRIEAASYGTRVLTCWILLGLEGCLGRRRGWRKGCGLRWLQRGFACRLRSAPTFIPHG